MAVMILRAVRGFSEEKNVEGKGKDAKVIWPAIKVGQGHLFGHPNAERVKRLLSIGPGPSAPNAIPVVVKATDQEVLTYVRDAMKGQVDAQGVIVRAPINFNQLDRYVQAAYLELAPKSEAKQAVSPSAAAVASSASGEEDDDVEQSGEDKKPRKKGARR